MRVVDHVGKDAYIRGDRLSPAWCTMSRLLRRLRSIRRRYGGRAASALLLVVFALTAAGVPLPTGQGPPKSGELFPCATCKCGCATAEQCWRSCCCHTLAERLAWARENGVEPPAFALVEARREGLLADSPSSATCCAKRAAGDAPSCCQKQSLASDAGEPACCQKHIVLRSVARTSERPNQSIVAWRALACGGHSLQWLAAVPTLVTARSACLHQLPLVAWLGPAASERGQGLSDDPAVPPPERA
jgi:hypothetical protein